MDFKNWILLIENQVLLEISTEYTKIVKDWYRKNKDNLPFSDIFGAEKTRLVIPVDEDQEAASILERIRSMNATIDFSSGLISFFDDRTNKYRETRLGKFILNEKSPFTDEEKKWWKFHRDAFKALELTSSRSDYAIIISRHPIDLLRMSDHDGWRHTCHAPGGRFFPCAIAESKGSGAIAYVIKKSDLARINLDDDEIFEDRDRRISGVSAIARVRLRKFVHKEDDYDLAVPEDRVYGVDFPGFLETVRSWSLDKQKRKIGNKRPSMREFELKGGSYRDTTAGTLFNYFFGDDEDRGDADYTGEEAGDMAEIWDQEVQQLHAFYRDDVRDEFSFDAEVKIGEDEPYVVASAWFNVPFSLDLLKKIKEEVLRENNWKITSEITRWTDLPTVEQIELQNYNNKLILEVSLQAVAFDNPDEYSNFLYDLARFDENDVRKIASQIYDVLLQYGAISSSEIKDYVTDYEDDTFPHKFTHFDLSEDDTIWTLELKSKKLIVESEEKFISKTKEQEFSNLLMQKLQNWADQILQMKKRQKMLFDPQYVNFHKRPFAQDFAIKPQFSFLSLDRKKEQPPFHSEIRLQIDFTEIDEYEDFLEVKEFVQFIDQNFEEFQEVVYSAWFAINK